MSTTICKRRLVWKDVVPCHSFLYGCVCEGFYKLVKSLAASFVLFKFFRKSSSLAATLYEKWEKRFTSPPRFIVLCILTRGKRRVHALSHVRPVTHSFFGFSGTGSVLETQSCLVSYRSARGRLNPSDR